MHNSASKMARRFPSKIKVTERPERRQTEQRMELIHPEAQETRLHDKQQLQVVPTIPIQGYHPPPQQHKQAKKQLVEEQEVLECLKQAVT